MIAWEPPRIWPDKVARNWRTVHDRVVEATPGFEDAEHWTMKERLGQRLFVLGMSTDNGGGGLAPSDIRQALNLAPKFTGMRVGSRMGYSVNGVVYVDGLPVTWVETELHNLATDDEPYTHIPTPTAT